MRSCGTNADARLTAFMDELMDTPVCFTSMLGLSLIKNFRLFSYSEKEQFNNELSDMYLIISFSRSYCFTQLINEIRVQNLIDEN